MRLLLLLFGTYFLQANAGAGGCYPNTTGCPADWECYPGPWYHNEYEYSYVESIIIFFLIVFAVIYEVVLHAVHHKLHAGTSMGLQAFYSARDKRIYAEEEHGEELFMGEIMEEDCNGLGYADLRNAHLLRPVAHSGGCAYAFVPRYVVLVFHACYYHLRLYGNSTCFGKEASAKDV